MSDFVSAKQSEPSAERSSSTLMICIAIGLIAFLVSAIYWYFAIRPFYFPMGDEFSLIVNSTHMFHPQPLKWITEGYRDYLIVYPQWSVYGTNFLRPDLAPAKRIP